MNIQNVKITEISQDLVAGIEQHISSTGRARSAAPEIAGALVRPWQEILQNGHDLFVISWTGGPNLNGIQVNEEMIFELVADMVIGEENRCLGNFYRTEGTEQTYGNHRIVFTMRKSH